MYKLIKTNGEISYQEDMTLEEMQKFVGGYIEMVGNVICNEEGRLMRLEPNEYDRNFVGNIIIKERK